MPTIQVAKTTAEIGRCFSVMHQLRPALLAEEFVCRIQAQQAEGYQLAFLDRAAAGAGIRRFHGQADERTGRHRTGRRP